MITGSSKMLFYGITFLTLCSKCLREGTLYADSPRLILLTAVKVAMALKKVLKSCPIKFS